MPPPAPRAARFVEWDLRGTEARVAAAALRGAKPAVDACARGAASNGWIHLRAPVSAGGGLTPKAGSDELPGALERCVAAAFGGIRLEGAVATGAEVSLWISITDGAAAPLPSLSARERLVREPAGACAGIENFECPPHKDCAAPKRRVIACPEEHGVPAQSALHEAERRLDLSVSGGKTGQGSEQLSLWIKRGACVGEKRLAQPGDDLREAEAVDVPCADFERVWSLAQKKLRGQRPKGAPGAHAVTHHYALFVGSPSGVPSIVEGTWAGAAGTVDALFAEVATQAAALVQGRGSLRLARLP